MDRNARNCTFTERTRMLTHRIYEFLGKIHWNKARWDAYRKHTTFKNCATRQAEKVDTKWNK